MDGAPTFGSHMPHPKYLHAQSERLYFRRRIPGLSTTIRPILISLGTKDEIKALIWLRTVSTEFETVLNSFTFLVDPLSEEQMHTYMHVRLKQTVTELQREGRMEWFTGREGGAAEADRPALRHALTALVTTSPFDPFPIASVDPNWTSGMLDSVMRLYAREANAMRTPTFVRRLEEEFEDVTGTLVRSVEHRAQIAQIYLKAKLMSLDQLDADGTTTTDLFKSSLSSAQAPEPLPLLAQDPHQTGSLPAFFPAQSLAPNERGPDLVITPGVTLIHGPLTKTRLTEQFAVAAAANEALHRSPAKEPYGVDFAGVCERSIKMAQLAGTMDDKTADARRAKIMTFCILADVQCVTEVEQHHFRIFDERMADTHRNLYRSPKHNDLTWEGIKSLADDTSDEELGRAPKTFNTYLEQVSAVLDHARSNEGSLIDLALDASKLRKPENNRQRKKRAAFKPDEVIKLFQHPVWQGCSSNTRRHEQGSLIEKDGLFFVPLLVAYSGARMEEIAGLTVDGVVNVGDTYGLDIRPHDQRRLKNLQSERLIPLHDHLVELGLIEHRDRMRVSGQKLLFPELEPKSKKKKFGSALRYNWEKIRDIQLDGNHKNLDAHSLRHTFNQFLKNQKTVSKDVRLDLLGHSGTDLNEEVYGDEDGMPFEMKKAAIDMLPRVF